MIPFGSNIGETTSGSSTGNTPAGGVRQQKTSTASTSACKLFVGHSIAIAIQRVELQAPTITSRTSAEARSTTVRAGSTPLAIIAVTAELENS
jgi:hypothetical protein